MKMTIQGVIIAAIITLAAQASAQLQFTGASATKEGAIQLQWQSESNAVYRIEYASQLVDPNLGYIVWQTLYEDYPAIGTNTIWMDAGNPSLLPIVPHPRDEAARFYRIVQTDTNDLASAPQVSVLAPTNNATLTGDVVISVSATSSLGVDFIRLFVDGQEVGYQSDTETNFLINTCQFPNGTHQVYAIAENSSGSETTGQASDFQANLGVSPRINVTFDNFITDYRGKLEFQDPDLGETNRFTADFAAYADWTLTITNESGVAVRTVTGTGFNMAFDWDSTGDGGTNLPSGAYGAVLSASESSSSLLAGMLSMMPPAVSDAIANGQTSYFITPPPMPPIMTNINGIRQVIPWEDAYGPQPLIEVPIRDSSFALASAIQSQAKSLSRSGPTPDGPGGGQTTLLIPMRYIRGRGTFGVAGQGNHPNGVTYGSNTRPSNGLFGRVTLNVSPGSYGNLKAMRRVLTGFYSGMHRAGYRLTLQKLDSNLAANDLRKPSKGGSSVFNNVNIGLLVNHGVCSANTSAGRDYTISGSGPYQSYTPIYTGGNGYDWVRLSEWDLGGAGTNGLRWMGMLSCNNMVSHVFSDCYNKEVLPINDYLHLLCGAKTTVYIVSNFGIKYSAALCGQSGVSRQTVVDSWFYAGHQTQGRNPNVRVVFRVTGWPACFSDDLVDYSDPDSGNPADITFQDEQVTTW